jgi:hypothetical protein
MTFLPPDLKEHAGTISAVLIGLVAVMGGALAGMVRFVVRRWEKQEAAKENTVAEALKGVGTEISKLGDRFDSTVRDIFAKIGTVEEKMTNRVNEVHERILNQAIKCAALHGPSEPWDGRTERRSKPRGPK